MGVQVRRQLELAGMRVAPLLLSAVLLPGCGSSAPPTDSHPATAPTSPVTPTAAVSLSTGQATTLAIVGGMLIDGTGAGPVANAVILIAGDRIVAVGARSGVAVPDNARRIDVHGATILPGFINAHVHGGFTSANLETWAQGGVTTIRDESALPSSIVTLKELRAALAKDPQRARLVSAGTMLAVPGGYGQLTFNSVDEAIAVVDREFAQGVDAVKVALEDGYAGEHDLPKPTPEELAAIVAAGVDDSAHAPYDAVPDSVLRQMVAGGTYLVPTFTVFRNYGAPVEGCVDNVRRFVALGGRVVLGNDYAGGPGDFEGGIPMYEIETMREAGMTPMQIIESATSTAAAAVGLSKEAGTLQAGKAADVLVVEGDPLSDLETLRNIRLVIHAGAVIRGA
jgi:imidazolonepropionase-like amidohydrolase